MTTDSRRPRALIIRHGRGYGPDLRREAEALVAAGFDCEVLHLGEVGAPAVRCVDGVTLRRLPGRKARGGLVGYIVDYGTFTLLAAGAVAVRHLRNRYDVIQVNTMPDFLVFAAIVPKLTRTPIVLFVKEPTPELATTLGQSPKVVRALTRLERLSLAFCDHAITVTDQLKGRLVERGARSSKVAVVYNGPNPIHLVGASIPPPRSAVDRNSLVVLCHGTIEDRYGHDTILNAAAIARSKLGRLEIVVTGTGTRVPQLLAHRQRLGLEDIVRYEGWVSDERLRELFETADVGIVAQKPSPYSHLVHTNKMYDFWIAGLPVLASRLDATTALFSEREIAYFDGDDPEELADQMVALARDPGRRTQLAVEGRNAWRRVGWHAQQDRYLAVFRSALGHRYPSAHD